jgi:hypothetical protein
VRAYVNLLATTVAQIATLEGELEASFGRHPAAEIVLSQPELGTILGARVLAEFGDDPDRYATAKARKNYAGTSPITRASTEGSCSPATRSTTGSATPCTRKPLPRSPAHPAPAPTTTPTAPPEPGTTKPFAPSRTGSSASSTGCLRHGTLYDEATAWPQHQHQQQDQQLVA